jgi:hypothetical protein
VIHSGALQDANGGNCFNVTPARTTPCLQGSVPPYALAIADGATAEADIGTGLRFAAQYNIRLVIKSSGHDFQVVGLFPSALGHKSEWIDFHDNSVFAGKISWSGRLTG